MALIDDVKAICDRLAPQGWGDVFNQHGLNIAASDLAAELDRPLSSINRSAGFEDFAGEGNKGIEAGDPARSLLFHGLASSRVQGGDVVTMTGWPTPRDLDIVENYVYAKAGRDMATIRSLASNVGNGELAVVVFSKAYRPAKGTVSGQHADFTYSRCGVARVGDTAAHWDGANREFSMGTTDSVFELRAMPALYGAYLATKITGQQGQGWLRWIDGDDARSFWYPLHKLFDGSECIAGENISLDWVCRHRNEKIARFHRVATARGYSLGVADSELDSPPYTITSGIASIKVDDPTYGTGWVIPDPHRMVEAAMKDGNRVTFDVPALNDDRSDPPRLSHFSSSLQVDTSSSGSEQFRSAPEYVHARHKVENGSVVDLNAQRDVTGSVKAGGYKAQHYVDWTGEGWVLCNVTGITVEGTHPAYSLVAAPDFFPIVDQSDLWDWSQQQSSEVQSLWYRDPETLADDRIAANFALPSNPFDQDDLTLTALIGPVGRNTASQMMRPHGRHPFSYLPDAASGIFHPGWDTGSDMTSGKRHLAAYSLGSPFPEDAKLCSALATYWPAVAPDSSRQFVFASGANMHTVLPLDDGEVGMAGSSPWDGTTPPMENSAGGTTRMEYASFDHIDYTQAALDGLFTATRTSQTTLAEYKRRLLIMSQAYGAVGATSVSDKRGWKIYSFTRVTAEDSQLVGATNEAGGAALSGDIYRCILFESNNPEVFSKDSRWFVRVDVSRVVQLFLDGNNTLKQVDSDPWTRV